MVFITAFRRYCHLAGSFGRGPTALTGLVAEHGAAGMSPRPQWIRWELLPQVEFKYLGVLFTSEARIEHEALESSPKSLRKCPERRKSWCPRLDCCPTIQDQISLRRWWMGFTTFKHYARIIHQALATSLLTQNVKIWLMWCIVLEIFMFGPTLLMI